VDALGRGVLLFNREPDAYAHDLRDYLVPEPVAGLAGDDAITRRVQIQIVFFAFEEYPGVVPSLVNRLSMYPEGEEPAGGGLRALERAYPAIHEGLLEDAAAVALVLEVRLAHPVLKHAGPVDGADLDHLVHLEGHTVPYAAAAAGFARPAMHLGPRDKRTTPHDSRYRKGMEA